MNFEPNAEPVARQWIYPVYLINAAADLRDNIGAGFALSGMLDEVIDEARLRPDLAGSVHVAALVHHPAIFLQRGLAHVADSASELSDRWLGRTSFRRLFRDLAEAVDDDIARLASSGARCYRPLTFLIFDRPPDASDYWQRAHRELVCEGEADDSICKMTLVPVCFSARGERAAAEMAFPPQDVVAYRIDDVTSLRAGVAAIVNHAVTQLESATHGLTTLLPQDSDLPPGVRVAIGPRGAPTE